VHRPPYKGRDPIDAAETTTNGVYQITYKMEEFLSLNTLSFLHNHSDQIKAIAPILICFLNLLSISFSQFPNIVVILHGGNKVEATWMTGHIDQAKRHWKNKCLTVSS
jgi:hypothetical protein